MKKLGMMLCAASVALPAIAGAASMDYLDGYYIADSKITVKDNNGKNESKSGTGFGIRGAHTINDTPLLFAGEYRSTRDRNFTTTSGTGDVNVALTRVGVGYNPDVPVYFLAEYIQANLSFDAPNDAMSTDSNGYAFDLGAKVDLIEYVTIEARVGYIDVNNLGKGFEYQVGLALNLDHNFGVFADYQGTPFNGDQNVDTTVTDFRAGMRFRF